MTDKPILNLSLRSDNQSLSTRDYYDPNKDECTLFARLMINTVIAGGVCALGLMGNALSFAVLRKDRQSPVASFLLQILAFTDSFFLGLWFVHFSVNDIFDFYQIDQYSHKIWIYTRLYTYPFLFIGQTGTIWLTVLIAVTRFIAICVPYKASTLCTLRMVKKSVITVAIFSVIYNLPRFFDTELVYTNHGGVVKYYFNYATLGQSEFYQLVYIDIAYYIFSFVLPLLLLAVLNAKLTWAYHKLKQKRHRLHGSSDHTAERRKSSLGSTHQDPNITLVMIIVVLVFMLCNLPARVVQIVWKYRDQKCMSPEFFVKEISNVMEVLNSSANFIIYCVFRQQFRDILSHQLCLLGISSPSHKQTNIRLHTIINGHEADDKLPPPEHV